MESQGLARPALPSLFQTHKDAGRLAASTTKVVTKFMADVLLHRLMCEGTAWESSLNVHSGSSGTRDSAFLTAPW